MSLKKESRSNNNIFFFFFFWLFSPRNRNYWSYMQKDKESNNSLFPILFKSFTSSYLWKFFDFIWFSSFPISVIIIIIISVIIIVLIPSARPTVKICAIFSIKITFVNGHGVTSSSSVLKRSKTNKRNRNDQDKTNKNKNKNNQKEKQNKTKYKTEKWECMFNVTAGLFSNNHRTMINCNQTSKPHFVLQHSNQKWKPCKIRGDTLHHDRTPRRWKFPASTHLPHEY